uniref:WRKY domain-containing protein n=1 Tax=Kalanchoe fedtschenkoi TaxID=63787 RepID=A0A7N0V3D2_KALFE
MAKNQLSSASTVSSTHHPPRPATIALPPRTAAENLFATGFAGFSPGPMTLASSLFPADAADPRSFSQLLAGAMASPLPDKSDSKYKQNRPLNLEVSPSPIFMVPPGFSPSGLLNSPGIFSPAQSPFGMSHQQALAQVTAQAALAQSNMQLQVNQTPFATPPESYKPPSTTEPKIASIAPSELALSVPKSQPPIAAPDKPVEDGYNWRKYGQKQVKGSEYPRSYYKCTHFHCPVKKKVERSPQGQIIEIIYKGQHNHEQTPPKKPAKDGNAPIENVGAQATPDVHQPELDRAEAPKRPMETALEQIVNGKDQKFLQEASIDSRPLTTDETRGKADNDNGPILKKRNTGSPAAEPTLPQKTVVEPKIVVQTRSEVDLLDDGFRWRKYGQKVVKGNSHPRSYYKCTTPGCNVRKHVERASADPKAVITTYEGKHNHDTQEGRSNSRGPPHPKSKTVAAERHTAPSEIEPTKNGQTKNGQTGVAAPQLQEKVNA